jgi:8-oxo-dGTP pyrophosphatase MutT (NUDIX family)
VSTNGRNLASLYEKPEGIEEKISAGGVVARVERGGVLVALAHEAGCFGYVLPKGHLKKGETREAAARREIEEEAGFTQLELIGFLDTRERLYYNRKAWGVMHYFLFVTDEVDVTPTDPRHPQPPEWFPIEDLPQMAWPEQQSLIELHRERIVAAVRGRSS